ncbi:unnamed protein product [Schistosoma curassoni]|uniref:Ovule protein n=1 Tax=Schistosoma curassoni TaxID=6186 RepID=A0A183JKI0_9TREM|nr:unnamed protein product [Schistosoma curassoni]
MIQNMKPEICICILSRCPTLLSSHTMLHCLYINSLRTLMKRSASTTKHFMTSVSEH